MLLYSQTSVPLTEPEGRLAQLELVVVVTAVEVGSDGVEEVRVRRGRGWRRGLPH